MERQTAKNIEVKIQGKVTGVETEQQWNKCESYEWFYPYNPTQ